MEAVIERMTNKDFTTVRKSNDRFDKFDWSVYKKQEVYKLRLTTDNIILGLICLIDHTDEETNAIEIELLEASVENMGPHKKLDHIAGCLIAFAFKQSLIQGKGDYKALLTFDVKEESQENTDKLMAVYSKKYNALRVDETTMYIMDEAGHSLIKEYLNRKYEDD